MFALKPLILILALGSVLLPAQAQIRVSGSDTLEGMMDLATQQYQRSNKVEFKTEFKGTNAGFKDLCDGKADIVPASSKISPIARRPKTRAPHSR